jgi:Transcriptional regulator, AbiEi antitoxin
VEDERTLRWQSRLQAQAGVVSREQARDAGFTEKAIDWRVDSGTWQRLYRGVYATFTGEPSRQARLWAVVLRLGGGVALSHETAAEIHGLIDEPAARIHVSIPAEKHPARYREIQGVTIHRSRCLVPEWQPPWNLPRTSVPDTVLDLVAAAGNLDDAYGWIAAALGRGLTTPQSLRDALASRKKVRGRAWIAGALQDAADGVHSPLQRRYVHRVERAHGLPTARRRAGRRHGGDTRCLDNLYEEHDVCVELDGNPAHPPEGRWRDTRRDNVNLAQGTETLRYGWPEVTVHPCRTAAEIAAVLRRRGWKEQLRRCGPECTAEALAKESLRIENSAMGRLAAHDHGRGGGRAGGASGGAGRG